jgi:hypothetical protein
VTCWLDKARFDTEHGQRRDNPSRGCQKVGSDPVILPLAADAGRVEVVTASDDRGRALGPLAALCAATGSIGTRVQAGQRGSLVAGHHTLCVMPARR